jgi:hypothetical protein
LAQYAARRNLQLVTAADFNAKLRERGCPKVATVQKICRLARDEDEVRRALDYVWSDSEDAARILEKLREGNEDLYRFEKMLETNKSVSDKNVNVNQIKLKQVLINYYTTLNFNNKILKF